jgi:hypothetical protein
MRVTRQKAKFLEEIALREEALNIDTTKACYCILAATSQLHSQNSIGTGASGRYRDVHHGIPRQAHRRPTPIRLSGFLASSHY